MFNKIMNRLTPLRLVIVCGVLATLAIVAYFIISKPAVVAIPNADTPLAATYPVTEGDALLESEVLTEGELLTEGDTLTEGEALTVRITADTVEDLYGYQFQMEYDDKLLSLDGIRSLLDDMPTIFKKDFDGYVLVGATMTGDNPGYSANDVPLCEIELSARSIGELSNIRLSKVNVVSSELEYTEDVTGWAYEIILFS